MLTASLVKKIIKILGGAITVFFLCITALTVLSLVGAPKQLGIFVVETGSMAPTIPAGSLLIDLKAEEYYVGDVITFNAPASPGDSKIVTITHRVNQVLVEDAKVLYETQGDANDQPDVDLRASENVIGRVLFHIPLLGSVVAFAKTKIGFIILIIIPTTIIIFSELSAVRKEFAKMRAKKKSVAVSQDQDV